jgi:hypothetical protein
MRCVILAFFLVSLSMTPFDAYGKGKLRLKRVGKAQSQSPKSRTPRTSSRTNLSLGAAYASFSPQEFTKDLTGIEAQAALGLSLRPTAFIRVPLSGGIQYSHYSLSEEALSIAVSRFLVFAETGGLLGLTEKAYLGLYLNYGLVLGGSNSIETSLLGVQDEINSDVKSGRQIGYGPKFEYTFQRDLVLGLGIFVFSGDHENKSDAGTTSMDYDGQAYQASLSFNH